MGNFRRLFKIEYLAEYSDHSKIKLFTKKYRARNSKFHHYLGNKKSKLSQK